MAYASCPDANSQPCTCTQSVICGGTDLREQHIALVRYVFARITGGSIAFFAT